MDAAAPLPAAFSRAEPRTGERAGDGDGAALIARAAAGDRAAFETFVRRWERPLGRFLLRVTGAPDRADEARQATFLRVLSRGDSFRGGQVSTWLFRTAYRIAVDLHRSESRHAGPRIGEVLLDGTAAATAAPDEQAADDEERALVQGALVRLGDEDRALLWLRVADGRSFADTAAVLGLAESTARLRFLRALRRLRAELPPTTRGAPWTAKTP